jgi:hypothetical protein
MGQLEYQAVPSLCGIAHDSVLCTLSYRSASRKRIGSFFQAAWTVHQVQNHSNPGSQAGRPVETEPVFIDLLIVYKYGLITLAYGLIVGDTKMR